MTRNRAFLALGLLSALLLAGVGSLYASSSPDGLERVATDHGFGGSAEEHPLSGSPLADYGTRGVENDRLSTSLAGLAGVTLTLLISGGLFMLIRRPSDGPADSHVGGASDGSSGDGSRRESGRRERDGASAP